MLWNILTDCHPHKSHIQEDGLHLRRRLCRDRFVLKVGCQSKDQKDVDAQQGSRSVEVKLASLVGQEHSSIDVFDHGMRQR